MSDSSLKCTRHSKTVVRADTNPANSWYRGEMDFLDHYILPMIEKLRVCGVLSTERIDSYSRNATINRKEWEKRGEEIVDEMVRRYGCERPLRVSYKSSDPGGDRHGLVHKPTTQK
jgi:hypothetical protein